MKRLFLLAIVLVLSACDRSSNIAQQTKRHVVKAKLAPMVESLHYQGQLMPFVLEYLYAPSQGMIKEHNRPFASQVNPDQVVMTLQSSQLNQQLAQHLLNFLKSRSKWRMAVHQLKTEKLLWKAGNIADDDWDKKQHEVVIQQLEVFQHQRTLEDTANQLGIAPKRLTDLNLEDVDAVQAMMSWQELIMLHVSHKGVLLPLELSEQKPSKPKDVMLGSKVEKDQPLAIVADQNRFQMLIDVHEMDINRLQDDMAVKVSGPGFPGVMLTGRLRSTHVLPQRRGGTVTYPVKIMLDPIPKPFRRQCRLGMSARVDIRITHPTKVMIPAKAVVEEKGLSMVRVLSSEGKESLRPIIINNSSRTDVLVQQGLRAGEKVVFYD